MEERRRGHTVMIRGFLRIIPGIAAVIVPLFCGVIISCETTGQEDRSTIKRVIRSIDGKPVVPQEANSLSIQVLSATVVPSEVESRLRAEITKSINLEGRLGVTDEENPDLTLRITVIRYAIQVREFDEIGQPLTARMWMRVAAVLKNHRTGDFIFVDNNIEAGRVFSEIRPPIQSKPRVLDEVIEELSRKIARKTIKGWYTELMSPLEKRQVK